VQAPNANAHAERWVRTVRRECLDRTLVAASRHLEQLLRVYVGHYDRHRPHRSLALHPPDELRAIAQARARSRDCSPSLRPPRRSYPRIPCRRMRRSDRSDTVSAPYALASDERLMSTSRPGGDDQPGEADFVLGAPLTLIRALCPSRLKARRQGRRLLLSATSATSEGAGARHLVAAADGEV
jgi:hypothetical protein